MTKRIRIYLIERNDPVGYDEYDAAVVAAKNPEEAVEILKKEHGKSGGAWGSYDVSVAEIAPNESKIILESFCAG